MIGLVFAAILGIQAGAADPPSRPNVLFILIDDLGCRDLGSEGHPEHKTPHLDAIRGDGVRFRNAYCNAPNCAPSRAALMTGRHGARTGVHTVGSPRRGPESARTLEPPPNRTTLSPDETTLAEPLRLAGYRTGYVGKWHLGDDPTSQGFERNVGGSRRGHPRSYFPPYENAALEDGPEGEYLVDRLGREVVDLIDDFERESPDSPWFVVYAPYAVHTPIQAPDDAVAEVRAREPELSERAARYAVLVETVDSAIGQVVDALDLRETFVFVMSDNGGLQPITDMSPWRGGKGMLYEGGVRTPLYVDGPGIVPAEVDVPVQLFDLFPTVLDLARIEPVTDLPIDGRSLKSAIEGRDFERGPIFWHFPAYLEGRDPESREPSRRFRTTPCGAVRAGRWKLVEWFEDGDLDLFDLESDPCERVDVSNVHPELTRSLAESLIRWREEVGAPMPTPTGASSAGSVDGGLAD